MCQISPDYCRLGTFRLHSNFVVQFLIYKACYDTSYALYVDIIIDINPGLIMVLVIFTGL